MYMELNMKCAIVTVEIADPDFANIVAEFARYREPVISNDRITEITNEWSAGRWPRQIMRVHRYNCNLPALRPENTNRPY